MFIHKTVHFDVVNLGTSTLHDVDLDMNIEVPWYLYPFALLTLWRAKRIFGKFRASRETFYKAQQSDYM